VNDDPVLNGPSRYWYRGEAGHGFGSNGYVYTYGIAGESSAENWARWSMGRRVGRQEIQAYVPSNHATATVTYRIDVGGREHTRRVAQRDVSGWTSLGGYDADGALVTVTVRDNEASQHHARHGLAASRIGVDAIRMRCISRCGSASPPPPDLPPAQPAPPPSSPRSGSSPYCDVISAGTFGGVQNQSGFLAGGSWSDHHWPHDHCSPVNVSGRLTQLFEFSLSSEDEVTIGLESSDADTSLSLSDARGRVIAIDDDGGSGTNSRITTTLAAGTYLVEAAFDIESESGGYQFSIETGPGTRSSARPASRQQDPGPSSGQSGPVAGCGVMHLGTIGPELGVFVDSANGPCPSGNQTYPHTGVFEFALAAEFKVDISLETQEGDERHLSLSDAEGQVLATGEVGGFQDGTWLPLLNYSSIWMTLPAGTYRIEAASSESAAPYDSYPDGGGGFLLGIYVYATNEQNDDGRRSPDSDADAGRATDPPPTPQPMPQRTDWVAEILQSLRESLREFLEFTGSQPEPEDTDCDKPPGNKYERKRDGEGWWGALTAEHRVFALQTFTTIDGARVEAGTKGGEVQHNHTNLSQSGCSWIALGAKANTKTRVSGNALVKGKAEVLDRAKVYGNAQVYGDSRVVDDARVYGKARVYGEARVEDDARVYGNAQVYGEAKVYKNAEIYGDAAIRNRARIYGNAKVHGNARVTGNARVYGLAEVTGSVSCININNERIYERADCWGDEIKIEPVVTDDARVYGDANVSGSARIVGNAKVYGDAEVTGTALIFGDMEIDSGVYDGTQEHKRTAEELYRDFYDELRSQLQDCLKTISERDLHSLTIHLMKPQREIGTVDEALNVGCFQNRAYQAAREALSVSGWELFLQLGLPIAKASKLKRLSQIADLLELAMLVHDDHEVGELVATVETLDEWGISEAEFKSYNDKVRVEYDRLLAASR